MRKFVSITGGFMKRYIVFTGIAIGATIMAVGAMIVVGVSEISDKLIWRK